MKKAIVAKVVNAIVNPCGYKFENGSYVKTEDSTCAFQLEHIQSMGIWIVKYDTGSVWTFDKLSDTLNHIYDMFINSDVPLTKYHEHILFDAFGLLFSQVNGNIVKRDYIEVIGHMYIFHSEIGAMTCQYRKTNEWSMLTFQSAFLSFIDRLQRCEYVGSI